MDERVITKYPYLTAIGFNLQTGEILNLKGIPMSLLLIPGKLTFFIEVWKSEPAFVTNQPSLEKFNQLFPFTGDELVQVLQAPLIIEMKTAAFEWLGVTAEDYELESLNIDLTAVSASVSARHKEFPGRRAEQKTLDYHEFEQLKAERPTLVEGYTLFTWGTAKTLSPRFQIFN